MEDTKTPYVGQAIRSLREGKNLSLRDLSQQCGLSINAISKIERGEASPTVASLHKISTALGVHITDFFTEKPNNDPYIKVQCHAHPRGRNVDRILVRHNV